MSSPTYGGSKSWLYELLARYQLEGDAAFEPTLEASAHLPDGHPATTVEI